MSSNTDSCKHIRELHDRLAAELRLLQEGVQEEEREGVVNPCMHDDLPVTLKTGFQYGRSREPGHR